MALASGVEVDWGEWRGRGCKGGRCCFERGAVGAGFVVFFAVEGFGGGEGGGREAAFGVFVFEAGDHATKGGVEEEQTLWCELVG